MIDEIDKLANASGREKVFDELGREDRDHLCRLLRSIDFSLALEQKEDFVDVSGKDGFNRLLRYSGEYIQGGKAVELVTESSTQRTLESHLKEHGIAYLKEQVIGNHVVDFIVEDKVLEVFGIVHFVGTSDRLTWFTKKKLRQLILLGKNVAFVEAKLIEQAAGAEQRNNILKNVLEQKLALRSFEVYI